MIDTYADLDTAEFNNRLRDKLEADTNLVDYLMQYAYDEMVELFNNAILDEWLAEHQADYEACDDCGKRFKRDDLIEHDDDEFVCNNCDAERAGWLRDYLHN